ncbi:MAG TPA: dicarboxylate/amino acid:cation symporter [Ignavibacteriaceae bacterium]|nr:dicarboxylate/amino acid:cation symporter [Ignavibacteriaceae bacterium]
MKFKLPKLHNQIIAALILGAVFGSIFNIKKDVLVVEYIKDKKVVSEKIEKWQNFILINPSSADTILFDSRQQLLIINSSRKISESNQKSEAVVSSFISDQKLIPSKHFSNITSIGKETTIPSDIKWIGDIFIRLLNMIAVPLVLASLVVGAASLGDIKKFARIGGKTISLYIFTTALAISIGLILANVIQPGMRMPADTKTSLLSVYGEEAQSKMNLQGNFSLIDQLVNLVPKNPITALANSEMIQIVFFAVFLGLVLSLISKEKSEPVIKFFDGLSESMIKMVDIIMLIAPLGVFALISATISEFGFDILQTLFWYAVTVLFGLMIQTFGVYSLFIKFFSKFKVSTFFKGIRRVQTIGFSTSSSAATLPVNIECCHENLGISKSITSFVLPLGATINMDGTALYQGVAAVFIAQVFGIDLTFSQQLAVVFTAVLASIGTAPVPGVGIIMLIVILKSVGIPEEGIALIIGIDRILDMCRTVTNVTGDAMVASVIATSEKEEIKVDLSEA